MVVVAIMSFIVLAIIDTGLVYSHSAYRTRVVIAIAIIIISIVHMIVIAILCSF